MEEGCYELKIDPELKMAMPPLSDTEYRELEENIKDNGCHSPIIVWNGVIVDGHNRYKICHENNIPFYVEEKQFESKADAKLWMLKEQLSRRNLSDVQRVFACLDMEPELLEEGRRRMGHKDDDALIKRSNHNTREIVAEMASANPVMVQRIKKIKQCADKQTIEDVYWGKVKVYTAWKKINAPQKQEKQVVPNTSDSIGDVDATAKINSDESKYYEMDDSTTPEHIIAESEEICNDFINDMTALVNSASEIQMPNDKSLAVLHNVGDVVSFLKDSPEWYKLLPNESDGISEGVCSDMNGYMIQAIDEKSIAIEAELNSLFQLIQARQWSPACVSRYIDFLHQLSSLLEDDFRNVNTVFSNMDGDADFERAFKMANTASETYRSNMDEGLRGLNTTHYSKRNVDSLVKLVEDTSAKVITNLLDDVENVYQTDKGKSPRWLAGMRKKQMERSSDIHPSDFKFIKESFEFNMRNMLGDIKQGLCWLRKEDAKDKEKKQILIDIVQRGAEEAVSQIHFAQGIFTMEEENHNKPVSYIAEPTEDPVTANKEIAKEPRPFEIVTEQFEFAVSTMIKGVIVSLKGLMAKDDNEKSKDSLTVVVYKAKKKADETILNATGS